MPQTKFKKISYIKKNKEIKKANPERIQLIKQLAYNYEMSTREVEELINNHNIDIAKQTKLIK